MLTSDRTSVPDVEVAAFVVRLGSEEPLPGGNEATADASGRYTITYDRAALGDIGKGPDLRVRAGWAGAEFGEGYGKKSP